MPKGRATTGAKTANKSQRQDKVIERYETVKEFITDYELSLGTRLSLTSENRYPMVLCTHKTTSEDLIKVDGRMVPEFRKGDAFTILLSKALAEKLAYTEKDIEKGIPIDKEFMSDKIIALVAVNGDEDDLRYKIISRGQGMDFYDDDEVDF